MNIWQMPLLMLGMVMVVYELPLAAPTILFVGLVTNCMSENLIRQFFATSFLFMAYSFYLKDCKKKMLVSLLVVPLIHYSGLYAVVLFLIFSSHKIPEKIEKKGIFVLLYVSLYFCWNPEWLNDFSLWLGSVTQSFSHNVEIGYLRDTERWFGTDGILDVKTGSMYLLKAILSFVLNILLIICGLDIKKIVPKCGVCFYFWYIGLVINTMGCGNEMFLRFSQWTSVFTPFFIGILLTYYKKSKLIKNMMLILVLVIYGYTFFSFSINMPFGHYFFWDFL